MTFLHETTARVRPVELTWEHDYNTLIDPSKVCAITVKRDSKRWWSCWLALDGAEFVWNVKSEREARDQQNYLMVKLGWLP